MIQINNSWVHAKDVNDLAVERQAPYAENKYEVVISVTVRNNTYLKRISDLTKSEAEIKATHIADAVTAELIKLKPNLIMQTE